MSLTMRTDLGLISELQGQLETALGACVDYHNVLVRAAVMDPVTERPEIKSMYQRFGLELEPHSLYGEVPGRTT